AGAFDRAVVARAVAARACCVCVHGSAVHSLLDLGWLLAAARAGEDDYQDAREPQMFRLLGENGANFPTTRTGSAGGDAHGGNTCTDVAEALAGDVVGEPPT